MISDLKRNTAFQHLNISASGLVAQRQRLDAISRNLANLQTTRTEAGGPYRPLVTTFSEESAGSFSEVLNLKQLQLFTTDGTHLVPELNGSSQSQLMGVAARVSETERQPRLAYDPQHPDADQDGYVAYPDINVVEEMTQLLLATRAYEANVTAMKAGKDMALKALEI
ncbi:MAG: flagellar basal body rod protein FlgC [Candidatus Delongbacteria bacterium]|nr:flagellar basal body rod protein FlgC [Candidatus Delongbacteria bacterium]